MTKVIGLIFLVVALTMLVFCLRSPYAEQVDHHGHMVNIDGHAAECLSCHDGLLAKSVNNCVGARCRLNRNSHPVAREYPTNDSFVKYGDVVRSGIKLDEGQVSCISCHDLRNQATGHPAVKDKNAHLCLACHKK